MKALTQEENVALQALTDFGYIDTTKKLAGIDPDVTRAIMRFQRHAARRYRLPQDTLDVFRGVVSGRLDAPTLNEIEKWRKQKWKLPLGRFRLTSLPEGGKLRSDAAAAWSAIVVKVRAAGGTLEGPYGDTTRGFGVRKGEGASRYSFHYAGRAVDIKQELAGGRNQRYFAAKDPINGDMFWRIWCRADAGKGKALKDKEKTYYDFWSGKDLPIPQGNYVDLTQLVIEDGQFERIRAQAGWEGNAKKREWWHFQYRVDKQATILDEMELIGISEATLRAAGWQQKDLDHAPG